MFNLSKRSIVPFLVAAATSITLAPAAPGREAEPLRGSTSKLQLHRPALESHHYIVALHDRGSVDAVAQSLADDYDLAVLTTWRRGIRGFLVEADRETARRLAADPRVRFVEQDVELRGRQLRPAEDAREVKAAGPSGPPICFGSSGLELNPYPAGSSTVFWGAECPDDPGCGNWGLDRIDDRQGLDGDFSPNFGPHEVDVFMVDSGIPLGHFELTDVDVDGIPIGSSNLEPFYHGTHVAGIIAGKNFGVARQNIRLRSLNIGSVVSLSNVVMAFEALFEARRTNVPTVATVSINNTPLQQSRTLAEVVRRAITERVTVINSAGNVGSDEATTCPTGAQSANSNSMFGGVYPGDVIIVGASNDEDGLYCECDTAQANTDCASRIGTAVDLYAPGAEIVSMSALADDAVCWLSGTSMAAPHAAGAAALLLSRFPDASPSAVQKALVRSATAGAVQGEGVGAGRLLFVGTYAPNRPVAGDQYLTAHAGDELLIPFADLVADDVDWRGRPLAVTGVSGPVYGTVEVVANNKVKFTVSPQAPPSTAKASTARFAYTVSNGVLSDTARVRIIVLPDAPDDEVVFGGTDSGVIDLETLLANDGGGTDPTLCPTVDTSETETKGEVMPQLNSDGICLGYIYTPPQRTPPQPPFAGTDQFDYLLFGGQGRATVTVRWNHPDFPTPPGQVLVNYPGHGGSTRVIVPVGAYLASWAPSEHTGITEYELTEELSGGVAQVVYRGPQTFYAVSGRSDGTRTYTARACTPSACSEPSTSQSVPFPGGAFSAVETERVGCSGSSACNPRRGLWHDPARSGNGIDLQRSSDGRWHLMLFTYREADWTPIWYQAQPAWIAGTCPSGVAGSYCMVTALEALRSVPGATAPARRTPFGFAVLSLQSSQVATLRVYGFKDRNGVVPVPGDDGYEHPLFVGNFRFLAGENMGATGNWQPTVADGTGLVITQLPPSGGYVEAFATVYFFRPDGSPTWVTTRNGTWISYPWSRYYGTAYPLYRRGENLCLACSGDWEWLDTNLYGYTTVDVLQPLSSTTGTARLSFLIRSGVDPAFPGGYGHSYSGGIRKVNP